MDKKKLLLDSIATSLESASQRNWNERRQTSTITAAEARDRVEDIFRSQSLSKLNPKDPGAKVISGMLALQTVFHQLPPSESEIQTALEEAVSDYHTFQALRILARLKIAPNSSALKNWEKNIISGLIEEPAMPKGPSPYRDAHRNMLIVSQIKQLELAGFSPTRNSATKHNLSGCDIVAQALSAIGGETSYSTVERIWKKRDNQPSQKYIAQLLAEAIVSLTSARSASDK